MLTRWLFSGADGVVMGYVGFAESNGATMEGAMVPIQPLADICGSFGKHFEDFGVVHVVVGLIDCFCGEYMCC